MPQHYLGMRTVNKFTMFDNSILALVYALTFEIFRMLSFSNEILKLKSNESVCCCHYSKTNKGNILHVIVVSGMILISGFRL